MKAPFLDVRCKLQPENEEQKHVFKFSDTTSQKGALSFPLKKEERLSSITDRKALFSVCFFAENEIKSTVSTFKPCHNPPPIGQIVKRIARITLLGLKGVHHIFDKMRKINSISFRLRCRSTNRVCSVLDSPQ